MQVVTRPRLLARLRAPVRSSLAGARCDAPAAVLGPRLLARLRAPVRSSLAGARCDAPAAVLGPSSVVVTALALLCAGVALAGPAAAVDDVARPDARVTHGPSCHPGGVVVEVTGGTVGYAVTLATTRRPSGEQTAQVTPGAVVVLSTGPVEWGETIDPFLEYTVLDGSGGGWVDELTGYSFTRPAAADCAAISPPSGASVVLQAGEVVPMPVPGPPDPSSVAPAGIADGTPAVPVVAQEAAAVTGGVTWPSMAAGGSLVVSGAGLALVAGSRWPRARRRTSATSGGA